METTRFDPRSEANFTRLLISCKYLFSGSNDFPWASAMNENHATSHGFTKYHKALANLSKTLRNVPSLGNLRYSWGKPSRYCAVLGQELSKTMDSVAKKSCFTWACGCSAWRPAPRFPEYWERVGSRIEKAAVKVSRSEFSPIYAKLHPYFRRENSLKVGYFTPSILNGHSGWAQAQTIFFLAEQWFFRRVTHSFNKIFLKNDSSL